MTYMREDITLRSVIENIHIYENPTFNFVASEYNPHTIIRHNGDEIKLEDIALERHNSSIRVSGNLQKAILIESIKSLFPLLITNIILTLITSGAIGFQMITSFDLNYLRYIAIEFGIASTVFAIATNACKLHYSNRLYKTDYIINSHLFDYSKKPKHTLSDSVFLVSDIIDGSKLCCYINDKKPYDNNFFRDIKKAINKVGPNDNLEAKYLHLLNNIVDNSSLLKVIAFSLLSASIQALNIVDYYNAAGTLQDNVIFVSFVLPIIGVFLSINIMRRMFSKACSSMMAYLMLFSYQYLS